MKTRARTRTTKAEFPEQHERDAARRYLEHSHSAQTMRGEPARVANEHATAIDEEHPRARDIALTGTVRELGKLPSHLRRHQREERGRARISTEQAAEIRREYRRGPYREPGEEETGDQASRRERIRGTVAPAATQLAGAAGAATSAVTDSSWGALIGQMFLWGIGLSIAYLLLTHDTGVSKLFEGATNATRAVVSPHVDPLNPKGAL